MAATYYSENLILDTLFRKSAGYSVPSTWYVGLGNAQPTESGTYYELADTGGYTRVAVTNNTANFGTSEGVGATNGVTTNLTSISFPQCSANWGTVTYVLIFDAETSGNLWFWQALSPSIDGDIGTRIELSPGAIIINNLN